MAVSLRVRVIVDAERARIWHHRLAEALTKRGHHVAIAVRRGGKALPLAASLLLTLEHLVYGQSGTTASAAWKPDDDGAPIDNADVILDMSGDTGTIGDIRTLRPIYAHSPLEEAALAELLAGRIPEVGILDSATPQTLFLFRAAVERPRVVGKAMDNLCARLTTIFVTAIDDIANGRALQGRKAAMLDANAGARLDPISALVARARMALTSLASKPPHWFVGWRRAGEDRVAATLAAPAGGWTRLPDDGERFFADPFVFARDGRIWLFLEEYQYAAGKALISVVELGHDGPIGNPHPIVERPYHLSYPFVFEHGGEIWMLPEMSAARRVELLRATQFPDRWETVSVLIEGEAVADATIVEHDNRLWLFASTGAGDESSWDTLHLWHASTLTGDWRPHERNPVLVDAGAARPAGEFFRRNGELWRPAQDCTAGYGSGLALAHVTQLDEQSFVQEVRSVLRPGGAWPGIGLHTLNWASGFEVVDGASAGKSS